MASKSFITWGVALLLATTLGCNNKKEATASCEVATNVACTFPDGSLQCTDLQQDNNNCGQCGNVCSSGQTCQQGNCKAGGSNSSAGGSSSKSSTSGKGGSSSSSSNKAKGGTENGGASDNGGADNGGADNGGTSSTKSGSSKGGTSAKTSGSNKGGTSSTSSGSSKGGTSAKTSGSTKGGTGSTSEGTQTEGGTTTTSSTEPDPGNRPKGYFKTSDWAVSSVDWHGCVWTGIDKVASTTTTITPQDFMAGTQGGPYQVTGKVNKAYEAVALLGFNIGEAAGTDADQCKYDAGKGTEDGPPSASMASITASTKGLAINWTAKTKPGVFRVQLQEPDCASNLAHCYCATITDATGPSFVPWTDFYAHCWNKDGTISGEPDAVKYKNQDIDAIVFSAPGNGSDEAAFDFTVVGFAPGDDASAAPGEATGCGQQSGKLGNVTSPSEDASMQRQVVTDANCKKYVVFNNNWGNPSGSIQTISYSGNSFTVEKSNGTGSGAPASFPCFYVGASGDLGGGTFNTWADTGLPKQISAITSAKTTFTYSGKTSGNFNAAYDVWFSKNQPKAGGYEDAISGFLMVWFYKPGGQVPIGSVKRTASIAGKTWDVWVGPRGNTKTGTDDANRPVVSYVAQSPITNLTFDLKEFMDDAVAKGADDKSSGGTSQAFANSWYLTDVFAGFEAWTGGDIVGIKETFSIEIK